MKRALVVLLAGALVACSTIIGVSKDVSEVDGDAAADAQDEGDAATLDDLGVIVPDL